jgi:hypothetical protein
MLELFEPILLPLASFSVHQSIPFLGRNVIQKSLPIEIISLANS